MNSSYLFPLQIPPPEPVAADPGIGGPVGGPSFTSGVGLTANHQRSSIWAAAQPREGYGTEIRRLTEQEAAELAYSWQERHFWPEWEAKQERRRKRQLARDRARERAREREEEWKPAGLIQQRPPGLFGRLEAAAAWVQAIGRYSEDQRVEVRVRSLRRLALETSSHSQEGSDMIGAERKEFVEVVLEEIRTLERERAAIEDRQLAEIQEEMRRARPNLGIGERVWWLGHAYPSRDQEPELRLQALSLEDHFEDEGISMEMDEDSETEGEDEM